MKPASWDRFLIKIAVMALFLMGMEIACHHWHPWLGVASTGLGGFILGRYLE
jgi:hypothetical protein